MPKWEWPDARGWIGLGCFVLTVLILAFIMFDRTLLRDDFFKVIATAIILNGWNNGPVGWAYQATKAGGELAERNATLVENQASTSVDNPQPVQVVNPPSDPVNTTEAVPEPELLLTPDNKAPEIELPTTPPAGKEEAPWLRSTT